MKALSSEDFKLVLAQAGIKRRLVGELRFNVAVEGLQESDWRELELLGVPTRSPNAGVLLVELNERLYVLPYELAKISADRATGVPKPIICDFCRTWRSGSAAARISFSVTKGKTKITSFLCCADLGCSRHVRGGTEVAILSRSQLRENITNEQRIQRHRELLGDTIRALQADPVSY